MRHDLHLMQLNVIPSDWEVTKRMSTAKKTNKNHGVDIEKASIKWKDS